MWEKSNTIHEKLEILFAIHHPHLFVLSQLSSRCVECKTVIAICKLFTVHLHHFKDGMPRNASHLMMLCTMSGFSHLPQHCSKSWDGLHQKQPVVSCNSPGEYLKESPQLQLSSNTHSIGCTEARSVQRNFFQQVIPIKQSQVKVPLPWGLPRLS